MAPRVRLRGSRRPRVNLQSAPSSMSVGIFRFSGLSWGWNYDAGKIAFCRQFAEGGQITELQIIPAAE
jgi:hypothetical protein